MQPERAFMGRQKAKIWTYLIFGVVLVVGVLIANLTYRYPDLARAWWDTIAALPTWAFPTIAGAAGLVIFWLGLKLETDWPEALGALMVAAAVAAGEMLAGWDRFALGGLVVLPFAIPILTFLALLGVGMARSR